MTTTKITDHVQQALGRLIEQYKGKTTVEGFVSAFVKPLQEMDDVTFSLFTEQFCDIAVGVQLDLFGTTVVQARQGFDDDFYRILLKAKIGINTSKAIPEDIMAVLRILTSADIVHYQNLEEGHIGLGTEGDIDPSVLNFFYENLQRSIAAGVRLDFLTCFDPDEPFTFDGLGTPIGLGFSSLAAPLTGGKFGFLHKRTGPPFAFAGAGIETDAAAGGFGTLADNLVGGIFQGL